MITPSQIKEKELSTASHGYNIDETNAFLSQIEESFSALYDENKELYRKMEVLATKIEEYREEEDSIKEALLTAQKVASNVEKDAREKSEKLLSDSAKTAQTTVAEAKEKAEKIISEAREYASQITKEKTDAAEAILNEANEKAGKELADAKADAAGLLTEAKNISQELLTKSQEEKNYYENLTNNLKDEADAFKDKLVELYNAQLEKLMEMMESPVAAQSAEIEEKIDDTQQNIKTVSEKIEEIEQDIESAAEQEMQAEEDDFVSEESEPADEPEETEAAENDFDVEYALEELSDDIESSREVPDINDVIETFSQIKESDEGLKTDGETEAKQPAEAENGGEDHLPFEDFFHVKPEGVRTNEKISLIPPDDYDDDDDDVKFKGFFKNKKKKK